jgi:hypothetical protein
MSIHFQEPVNLRKKCLETALKYTNQDRNAAHGDPEDNFRNIAAFWNAHLQTRYPDHMHSDHHGTLDLDATDVALMMAGMKAARLAFNPTHEDSWIDMAGYAACGMDVALRHATEQANGDGVEIDTEVPTFGDPEERLRVRQAAAWRAHVNDAVGTPPMAQRMRDGKR